MVATQATRKQLGAWYTPDELVDVVVGGVVDDLGPVLAELPPERALRVVDPACGDGRLLARFCDELARLGRTVEATGCDVDATALASLPGTVRAIAADALTHDWADAAFDVVIGNPPFLSQMAASTTRGGSSRHGGGPYADAAAEFLALAVRLADPGHGRIGLILPQSVLASRDAGPVRELVDRDADLAWSWWSPRQRHFDADVHVCALGFRRPAVRPDPPPWTTVVTDRLGIPRLPLGELRCDGVLADRAELNANFRDEYYALVGAVDDDADGPPLVTSGLIDPGRCHWGQRAVRFAKRDFAHPRIDLDRLEGRFGAWAERKLVPKVLVANQTRRIEAVADHAGAWLPGVPVTTVTPAGPDAAGVGALAAVLTSPVASAFCWHLVAGTGLSATTIRVGPAVLGAVPWPSGDLGPAERALADGDVLGCGVAVVAAFGLSDADDLVDWWRGGLPDGR